MKIDYFNHAREIERNKKIRMKICPQRAFSLLPDNETP